MIKSNALDFILIIIISVAFYILFTWLISYPGTFFNDSSLLFYASDIVLFLFVFSIIFFSYKRLKKNSNG